VFGDRPVETKVAPGRRTAVEWNVPLPANLPAGRHPFAVSLAEASGVEPVDSFVVIDAAAP
jgi:hypothetical protein